MKRKRKVRWSESVGAGQFHTSFLGTGSSPSGEYSLFVLCTLLFFGASAGMLRSVFEWNIGMTGMLFRLLLVTILVSILTDGASLFLVQSAKKVFGRGVNGEMRPEKAARCGKNSWLQTVIGLGIGVAGSLGFVLYVLRTAKGARIIAGLQAIGTVYLNRWNAYYKTGFRCPVGDFNEIETALSFSLTALCFLLVWWARFRKRSMTSVFVPVFVLTAELLVGEAPTGLSLFIMAAGVLLAKGTGFRKPEFAAGACRKEKSGWRGRLSGCVSWIPAGIYVLVLCMAVKFAGGAHAAEVVENGKQKIKQKQKEIGNEIADWAGRQEFNVAESVEKAINELLKKKDSNAKDVPESNYARLDNSKPEYNKETVLKVALESKPAHGIYLVGFYADEYRNGVWSTDVEAFEKASERAGFDPEELARELVSLGAERVAEYYGKTSLSEAMDRSIGGWLYYAQANMRKAYLPYFSKPESAEIRAEGDSRYIKEKNLTKVAFTVWNYDVNVLTKLLSENVYDGKNPEKRKDWEDWYESYVTEHYLDVPDGMEQVKRVADEIRISGKSFFRAEGMESVNLTRLNFAYLVADWMRENTAYSLELPELPAGSEPVEYFLGTSRKGYCMHYAGAAVMILRELGVPARYVSGYVSGGFAQDRLTGKYEAVVLDSNGHAWVEIYLEGMGWIPVEVTKGYSVPLSGETVFEPESGTIMHSESIPMQKPVEEGDADKPTVTPEPTGTPSPVSEEGQSVTPVPDDTELRNSGTEQKEDSEGTGKVETDIEGKTRYFDVNPVVLIFAFAGLGILIILPFFSGYRKAKQAADERRLRKKMKRRGNRQKIKLLNRRLYRKLRAKGKIRKKFVWDEEYEEVLRKQCKELTEEEKNRYMQLAKEATFSYHDFTEEDVTFCRQVYRKVLYEGKKRVK